MKYANLLRRAVTAFLSVVLLLTLAPSVRAAERKDTVYIQSAEDLIAFGENCTLDTWSQGKTVELLCDLSLDGLDFTPIPSFGGIFHGNGHTIRALSLNSARSHAGLFASIQETGAVYRLNVCAEIEVSGSEAAGGIAAVNHGRIVNCTFSGRIRGNASTGGIAGINALGGAVYSSRSEGAVQGSSMTGGIAGQNLGLLAGCTNAALVNEQAQDADLSAEDFSLDISFDLSRLSSAKGQTSITDTGGIAGYSCGVIRGCDNTAAVGYPHVGYNVGGIAGRSCGYVTACHNRGAVSGRKDVGGIVGQMEPYIQMTLSENMLQTLQTQLSELGSLVDQAANDAEGGVGGVTSRLNSMSGYIEKAASDAADMKVVIDADGSAAASGSASHDTDATLTPGEAGIAAGETGGASIDIDVSEGSVSIDLSHGALGGIGAGAGSSELEIDSSTSADGTVSGSAQIVATPDLGGLTSAISGLNGQLSQLNGAVAGTAGQLASDVRAINETFSELSNTLFDAVSALQSGEILSDTSAIDIAQITLGKVAQSQNSASVDGDLNVGGIAGCMANEYALDPEDDVSSALSMEYRREYELKAVLLHCTNLGAVTAKRSYVGGICGRMDLGLIADAGSFGDITSENGSYVGGISGLTGATIRSSFSKCTLQGKKYVGGIVGSGITETLTGAASSVSGCYSMVRIPDSAEYTGAISGTVAGEYLENYFVCETLAGIDGQSYGGKAEPIDYPALLAVEGLPEPMRKLQLRFVAEDAVLLEETFDYGDSFDNSIYPAIPEKDGYYAVWDQQALQDLQFDTVVRAVYLPYTTAICSQSRRTETSPTFLVEGTFNADASCTAQPLSEDTRALAPVQDGLFRALRQYLGQARWYQLPATSIRRSVLEQWHLSLPQDGLQTHLVHYRPADGSSGRLQILIRQDGTWRQADSTAFGSDLVFSISGTEADIAVVSVLPTWWAWLIFAMLLLGLILLLVRLLCRLRRKRQKEPLTKQQLPSAAPKLRKRRKWLLLLAILVLLLLLALCLFLGIGKQLVLRHALSQLDKDVSMQLTLEANLNGETITLETPLQRKTEQGKTFTCLRIADVPLYYVDGAVILENGTAYRLREHFPDYPSVLEQLAPLFQTLRPQRSGDDWQVTVRGETAQTILGAILPELTGEVTEAQQISVCATLPKRQLQRVCISASGLLQSGTDFSVTLEISQISDTADCQIPEAVTEAASTVIQDLPVITEDVLALWQAWHQLQQQEQFGAEIALRADCGPLTVRQNLDFYALMQGESPIYCIYKDGAAIYWRSGRAVRQDGKEASSEEAKLQDMSQLLQIAFLACQQGTFTKAEQVDGTSYCLQLSQDAMQQLGAIIAPQASALDLQCSEGSLTVNLSDGQIRSLLFNCSASVRVASLQVQAQLAAEITMTDRTYPLPEAVLKQLG